MKLKGEKCELKIISIEDLEAYYTLINNNRDRLKSYFPKTIESTQNLQEAKNHLSKINQKFVNKEIYPFGVFKNKLLIGWLSLKNIDWRIPKGELAYFIDKKYEGNGIISSALKEIIKFAFNELKMEKIYTRTGSDNLGSKKLAIKYGFKQEGILRNEFRLNGELIDTIYFGKLKNHEHE